MVADTNAGGQRINWNATSHGTPAGESHAHVSGTLGGFWRDCEWVYCRPEPRYPEGCYRPIEPSSFPLVAGVPARILRLRGYGNAIKPHVAAAFIAAYSEVVVEGQQK
jgi:DNA (cytosine-5)-methyltransferase 1